MHDLTKAAYNRTFVIGGVTCFYDTFVVVKRKSVHRMSICAKKPDHRQFGKR